LHGIDHLNDARIRNAGVGLDVERLFVSGEQKAGLTLSFAEW